MPCVRRQSARRRPGTRPRGAACRRRLPEAQMGAVIVVVGDVVAEESAEMTLVERDHVVEQIPSDTAHPAFCDAVLPGAPPAGTRRLGPEGFQCRDDGRREYRIPIEDQMAGSR